MDQPQTCALCGGRPTVKVIHRKLARIGCCCERCGTVWFMPKPRRRARIAVLRDGDDNPPSVNENRPGRLTPGGSIDRLFVASGQTGKSTLIAEGHRNGVYTV
jgi:hypothetical protein